MLSQSIKQFIYFIYCNNNCLVAVFLRYQRPLRIHYGLKPSMISLANSPPNSQLEKTTCPAWNDGLRRLFMWLGQRLGVYLMKVSI